MLSFEPAGGRYLVPRNLYFLNAVTPANVVDMIEDGVMICFGGPHGPECAELGRRVTGRTMAR